MYQVIAVDDWRSVDVYEVLQAMPADGKSMIIWKERSPGVIELDEQSLRAS